MNIKIYNQSGSNDEPDKIFISKSIPIEEFIFERNIEICFECGGYLMTDELDGKISIKRSTGLFTKNDQEIFEGDICEYKLIVDGVQQDYEKGEITFRKGSFRLDGTNFGYPESYLEDFLFEEDRAELEIVGKMIDKI